jgi:pimeloyl-ACP methyl ester carboxylesterase
MMLLGSCKTPEIRSATGTMLSSSIACLENVRIGGVDQWIMIRGANRNNPVILFLHGGPGTAQIAFARRFQTHLEKHFVVVNWDQRGSGKSYSEELSKEAMNIDQFVSDTYELIKLLLQRFDKGKIYLVGHSWGSIIGMLTAKRYPQLIHAYVSIGQVVDIKETGKIIFKFTLGNARQRSNRKALLELKSADLTDLENISGSIQTHIKWLDKFGGAFSKKNIKHVIKRTILVSPEYTLGEKLNYYKASSFCFSCILDELIRVDMIKQVPCVKVPVYFCAGIHDYNTPTSLIRLYYEGLSAPVKKLVWFSKSGHAPHFEEPEKFQKFIISTVLPETMIRN